MKTSQDPRHKKREQIVAKLFAVSFTPQQAPKEIEPIMAALPRIDQQIATAAPEWPLDKIAKIDLAILRLSVYELTIEKTEPDKVIIDEAIELAKGYGNTGSPSFVNGVLGTILKTL